jgi:hypothetical protein
MTEESRDDPPPPIRGGTADRYSAMQRRAAMIAPQRGVYASVGSTSSILARAVVVVQDLSADATEDEIVEAIRSDAPELASVVEPSIRKLPLGWTSYEWTILVLNALMLVLMVVGTFRPQGSSLTPEQIAQLTEAVVNALHDEETPPPPGEPAQPAEGSGGGTPRSE